MQCQRGDASASLCADESNEFSTDSRPGSFLLLRFHPRQSVQHALMLHWLQQIFGATCAHGCDDRFRFGIGRYSKAVHVWIFGAQSLGDPDRFLSIPIVVNKANAGLCEVQSAAYLSLNTHVMVQISDDNRSGHACHELRQGLVRRKIEADRHRCDSGRPFNRGHVHLLPGPCGGFVSNCFWSSGAIGILGNSGAAVGAAAGSTMVGVTITTSSEFVLFTDRERKSCPKIGRSPIPGTLENCAVVL